MSLESLLQTGMVYSTQIKSHPNLVHIDHLRLHYIVAHKDPRFDKQLQNSFHLFLPCQGIFVFAKTIENSQPGKHCSTIQK